MHGFGRDALRTGFSGWFGRYLFVVGEPDMTSVYPDGLRAWPGLRLAALFTLLLSLVACRMVRSL